MFNIVKFLCVLFLIIHSGLAFPILPRANDGTFHVGTFRIPVNPVDGQGYVVRVQHLHSIHPFISSNNAQGIEMSPRRLHRSNIGAPSDVVTASPTVETVETVENTLEAPPEIIDDSPPDEKEIEASVESLVTLITFINSMLEELTGESYLKDSILKENEIAAKQTENSFSIDKDHHELILTSESVSDPNQDNSKQLKQAMAILSDDKLEIIEKLGIIFENNTMKYDQTVIDVEKSSATYDDKDVDWVDEVEGAGNDGLVNNVDANGHSTDKLVTFDDLPEKYKQLPDAEPKQVDLSNDKDSKDLSPTGNSEDQLVNLDPKRMIGQIPDSSNNRKNKFLSVQKPKIFH